MHKNFLCLKDCSADELNYLLRRAIKLKSRFKAGEVYRPFEGKVLAMLFEKASTRTRVSFEAGMYQLGGYALFLLLGNLLFFGVHYGEALPVLLPLAGAGLLGALLGAGRRKKRRYA